MEQAGCRSERIVLSISETGSVQKQCPGREVQWTDCYFPEAECFRRESLTDLLRYLFDYGYCKKYEAPLNKGTYNSCSSKQ